MLGTLQGARRPSLAPKNRPRHPSPLKPAQGLDLCTCSCSCLLRALLRSHPFVRTPHSLESTKFMTRGLGSCEYMAAITKQPRQPLKGHSAEQALHDPGEGSGSAFPPTDPPNFYPMWMASNKHRVLPGIRSLDLGLPSGAPAPPCGIKAKRFWCYYRSVP